MEFTLKIRLGKNGAINYSVLEDVVRCVSAELAKRIGKRFKEEKLEVEVLSQVETAEFMTIGHWTVAPADRKLSDRLLAVFPWLTDENEASVSGADTIDDLQQLFHSLVADGR